MTGEIAMLSWSMLWALLPLVVGFLFRRGHLLFLIAGNNAARKPYSKESLLAGRYVGLFMYAGAILIILVFIPNIPDGFYYVFAVLFIALLISIIIYLNKRINKMQK
jgi:membrane-anchored protein YejM (alkaline phosphatase superfamily)